MTSTSNFGFYLPLVNNATDADLWGGEINTDLTSIDSVLITALNWTPTPATGTITVTAATSGSTTTGSSKLLYTCNATTGAFAANLPAVATASGMVVAFKKTDSTTNAITITGHSSDNIDGSNTYVLSAQYAFAVLVCDGTNWDIISKTAPAVAQFSSTTSGTVSASGGGTTNFLRADNTWKNPITGMFGAWVSKSLGTVYQAATDGFVVGYGTTSDTITLYSDSSNPPTTVRMITDPFFASNGGGFCMPVRKNDYYKVTAANTTTIFFLPLGN